MILLFYFLLLINCNKINKINKLYENKEIFNNIIEYNDHHVYIFQYFYSFELITKENTCYELKISFSDYIPTIFHIDLGALSSNSNNNEYNDNSIISFCTNELNNIILPFSNSDNHFVFISFQYGSLYINGLHNYNETNRIYNILLTPKIKGISINIIRIICIYFIIL